MKRVFYLVSFLVLIWGLASCDKTSPVECKDGKCDGTMGGSSGISAEGFGGQGGRALAQDADGQIANQAGNEPIVEDPDEQPPIIEVQDEDGDGFTTAQNDCDDTNHNIFPGQNETCDGIDQDCDGRVDEGIASEEITCGIGACRRLGARECAQGQMRTNCTPARPMAIELRCDGLDEDCDGNIDEDYPVGTPCRFGLGVCQTEGMAVCNAQGNDTECLGETIEPESEEDNNCDGVDNNCNGQIDEDYASAPIQCGIGACVTQGSIECIEGQEQPMCIPREPALREFLCDEIDEDCDGRIDEGFRLGGRCTEGMGACISAGILECAQDGQVICTAEPREPRAPNDETCDRIDDDCDGNLNEDVTPRTITCGRGACEQQTEQLCEEGSWMGECTPLEPELAEDAICDGLDEDCNGRIDEDFVGESCGVGECTRYPQCQNGQMTACIPGEPRAETCNQRDENCDGIIDNIPPYNWGPYRIPDEAELGIFVADHRERNGGVGDAYLRRQLDKDEVYFSKLGLRNGFFQERVGPNGPPTFGRTRITRSNAWTTVSSPSLTFANNEYLVGWVERTDGNPPPSTSLKMAHLDLNGYILDDENRDPRIEEIVVGSREEGTLVQEGAIAHNGEHLAAAYTMSIIENGQIRPHGLRVKIGNQTTELAMHGFHVRNPQLVWGTEQVLVLWEDSRNQENYQLYYVIVSNEGQIIVDERQLSMPDHSPSNAFVARGVESYGVSWFELDEQGNPFVQFSIINHEGERTFDFSVTSIEEQDPFPAHLTWNGEEYALLWGQGEGEARRGWSGYWHELKMARFTNDGRQYGETETLPFDHVEHPRYLLHNDYRGSGSPRIVWSDNEYRIFWNGEGFIERDNRWATLGLSGMGGPLSCRAELPPAERERTAEIECDDIDNDQDDLIDEGACETAIPEELRGGFANHPEIPWDELIEYERPDGVVTALAGQLIVEFMPDSDRSCYHKVKEEAEVLGLEPVHGNPVLNTLVLFGFVEKEILYALEATLRQTDGVLSTIPNGLLVSSQAPNRTCFNTTRGGDILWWQRPIGLTEYRTEHEDECNADNPPTIAILEPSGGPDRNHITLQNTNFVTPFITDIPENQYTAHPDSHATTVTSIVASSASNNQRTIGVSPGVPVLVWPHSHAGNRSLNFAILSDAIEDAVDKGAFAINFSMGPCCDDGNGGCDIDRCTTHQFRLVRNGIKSAVRHVAESDRLLIMTSNNTANITNDDVYFDIDGTLPENEVRVLESERDAYESNVIIVSGLDEGSVEIIGETISQVQPSNCFVRGDVVDIAAPADNIIEVQNDGSINVDDGTSYAAPMVTGAAALLRCNFPNFGGAEIKQHIVRSARTITETQLIDGIFEEVPVIDDLLDIASAHERAEAVRDCSQINCGECGICDLSFRGCIADPEMDNFPCGQQGTCVDAECIEGFRCANDDDCAACFYCEERGFCVSRPDGAPCGQGTLSPGFCEDRQCVAEQCCDPCGNANCNDCQQCDPGTGQCVPAFEGNLCDGGSCQNGQCISEDLCTGVQCGACTFCDSDTGDCVPQRDGAGCSNGGYCESGECIACDRERFAGQMCDSCAPGHENYPVCSLIPETCNGVDDNANGGVDEENEGNNPPLCENGLRCHAGECRDESCLNQANICDNEGATRCESGTLQTCGRAISCLIWSDTGCGFGESCQNGQCAQDDLCAQIDCGECNTCDSNTGQCNPIPNGQDCAFGQCQNGQCVNVPPEECDGIDSDNDGRVDEFSCQAGTTCCWQAQDCISTTPPPAPETSVPWERDFNTFEITMQWINNPEAYRVRILVGRVDAFGRDIDLEIIDGIEPGARQYESFDANNYGGAGSYYWQIQGIRGVPGAPGCDASPWGPWSPRVYFSVGLN